MNYTFATFLATCLERNKCPHRSNDFFDILINLELTFEQKLSKTLFRIFFFTARFGYSYLKKEILKDNREFGEVALVSIDLS